MDAGLAGPGSWAVCIQRPCVEASWLLNFVGFIGLHVGPANPHLVFGTVVSPFCAHLSDGEGLSAGGERDGPLDQEMSLGSGPGAPRQCLALAYLRHCYQ